MKKKIVFVDDYPNFAKEMAKLLNKVLKNVEVMPFEDPRDALTFILSNNIDILVTDHDMPYMNGTELIQKVKEKKTEIKVVMFSGGEDKVIEGMTFITKGNVDALLTHLNSIL